MEDMEPLLLICPGCQKPLEQTNYNGVGAGWHAETCREQDCILKYVRLSSNENDGYLKFMVKDFYVYVYIDYMNRKDQIIIYPTSISRQEKTISQIFIIPRFKIEWDKLDYYNERWKLWKVFS